MKWPWRAAHLDGSFRDIWRDYRHSRKRLLKTCEQWWYSRQWERR